MQKPLIPALVLAVAIVAPSLVAAHDGHVHKILGTVANVQGNQVEVKTTTGKVVTVMLDAKTTTITRGKIKLDATALKVGERVSVDYLQQKTMNMAKTIKLGETPAAAKK